jgi:hypothetical protein
MEVSSSSSVAKTALEIFEEEQVAKYASMQEEAQLELAKAKAKLKEAQIKKKFKDEMAEIEAQMAAMLPRPLNYAGAVIAENAHLVAIAAAGGGDEDENIVEHIAEHFAENEPVMYKLFGFCNYFINGRECRFEMCQYTHPEVEFKPNEYNFPKKLQTTPDGSKRDYRLMGFCVDTLNGRHCKNNRCRFKHPKDYQFGEIPAGEKRELGAFRKNYPNWPTA